MTARLLRCRSSCALAGIDIALVALAVYLLSTRPDLPAANGPATASTPGARPSDSAEIDTAIDTALGPIERYRAMIERPLFDAGRRPPPAAEAGQAQSAPPQAPPEFVLEGVILAPDRRSAIFRNKTTSKALRAAEGARVGEWTVETLEPQRVVLKHRDTAHEITLRHFDSTPPAGGGVHPAAQQRPRGPAR